MIAGQHAETAGCDGQSLVETELGGKIGYRILQQTWSMLLTPCPWAIHVSVKRSQYVPDALGKVLVLKPHPQFVIRDFAENCDRIVVKILPATRRQFLKNILRFLIPGPPKILGQLVQTLGQFSKLFVC